ncbi:hypothetical protein ACP275_05G016200 [Erythranthe tilingii]
MLLLLLFAILHYVPSFNVALAFAGENTFTPKAYLIRYWNKQISNNFPKPSFLFDKASPLTAAQSAAFYKLAATDRNSLSNNLSDFCTKANLLCFPDLSPSLEKHNENVNFTSYLLDGQNFTNYGTGRLAGADSFKNYSDGANVVTNNFRRYSRDSTAHTDKFAAYATDTNVPDESFKGYGTTAAAGDGQFTSYNDQSNVPNLRFAAYSDNSNGRKQTFAEYAGNANHGDQKFTSYGKNGNGAANGFTNYGKGSNVMGSSFENYGETANGGHHTFTSYGDDTNVPENTFRNYGPEENGAVVSFKSYRNDSNTGQDNFQSYGKKSNAAELGFENYGQSFNGGSSKFTGYGEHAMGQAVDFKVYGQGTTFKQYAKKGVTFASYTNESSPAVVASLAARGKKVNKWVVEPGKFFRESMLKSGIVMPMPDIRDRLPKRSFLPRAIISKLPFSTSKIREMEKIFHAGQDSSMANILTNTLNECERKPSPHETKRCVASIEDMIDFSTSVLGRNVVVHTTENTRGSNGNITIGKVKGFNGGKVTKSVSCHQSLFPYMLYYCHSVPKVRVYEAVILDPKSRAKINNGVAICHLDTSSWSPGHGAFIALGSGPGKIEVCHWIFENDMTWTIAD